MASFMSTPTGPTIDPVYLALSKLKKRQFDACIDICTRLLAENPLDQAVWFLKCRALTEKAWIDDTEMEEEGVAEVLLDENATAAAPRPGTSLARPGTSKPGTAAGDQSIRPMTSSGMVTGFARPGTQSRLGTGQASSSGSVDAAFRGSRPGTSRPMTSLGRQVRLGTASMRSDPSGAFINADRLDMRKYAQRPAIAKALCDYLLYHDGNPRKALELAAEATRVADFKDWWWKARLGKCYYKLGMFRDAEKQFKSALKEVPIVWVNLELCKVYVKLDQPNTAIEAFGKALELLPADTCLLTGIARIHSLMNNMDKAVAAYKKILSLDPSHVESIASLGSHHFYSDQPELALKFYRRLLQMGAHHSSELWNNIGLCCFYASQYDMALDCFQRALAGSDDNNMADVWYNIGQVAIGIGDLGLAYQAFKIAVSVNSHHAESFSNLGVLELRKGNIESARANFATAQQLAPFMFEPFFNGALLSYKLGDFQDSFEQVSKALEAFPGHSDSQELHKQLRHHFTML